MALGYSTITIGGQIINLRNAQKTLVPGTIKQKVGGRLVKHEIPDRSTRDIRITARGIMVDTAATAATTARRLLDEKFDLEPKHYIDGLTTASMIIESLNFDDNENSPLHFEYNISMIEYNQA